MYVCMHACIYLYVGGACKYAEKKKKIKEKNVMYICMCECMHCNAISYTKALMTVHQGSMCISCAPGGILVRPRADGPRSGQDA